MGCDVASEDGDSSWCFLNEAGDRYTSNYDIWGYGRTDGEPNFALYRSNYSAMGEVIWY